MQKKGCPYGTHRVISPKGVLPQPADVIDNTMEIYDNEVLIDVKTLNIDSASFTEIEKEQAETLKRLRRSCSASLRRLENIRTHGLVQAECLSVQLRKSVRTMLES